MAKIEIESAFVEDWNKNTSQHPAWGMKTAEAHSKKNAETNKYESLGRTFRTVKVSRASGIDLTEYTKGDRVHVWGAESTESREFEGKTYYELIVWADRIERVESKGQQNAAPTDEPWAATAPAADTAAAAFPAPAGFDDELPF